MYKRPQFNYHTLHNCTTTGEKEFLESSEIVNTILRDHCWNLISSSLALCPLSHLLLVLPLFRCVPLTQPCLPAGELRTLLLPVIQWMWMSWAQSPPLLLISFSFSFSDLFWSLLLYSLAHSLSSLLLLHSSIPPGLRPSLSHLLMQEGSPHLSLPPSITSHPSLLFFRSMIEWLGRGQRRRSVTEIGGRERSGWRCVPFISLVGWND